MGRQVTVKFATLAAWSLVFFASIAFTAQAKDSGPGRDVRQVRGAAQTLIPSATIENVVVDHSLGRALVQWSRSNGARGIDGFAYIYDRWWDLLDLRADGTGTGWCGGASAPFEPGIYRKKQPFGIEDLIAAGVPRSLVAEAVNDFDGFNSTTAQFAQALTPPSLLSCSIVQPGIGTGILEPTLFSAPWQSDGYTLQIRTPALVPAKLTARRPNNVENWTYYPGGNAYVYFTLITSSDAAIDVPLGTSVDIWFPFVLDTTKTYSLTLAKAVESVGPIDGKLRDNVVHFELPAFTVPAGATLIGEVDGTI